MPQNVRAINTYRSKDDPEVLQTVVYGQAEDGEFTFWMQQHKNPQPGLAGIKGDREQIVSILTEALMFIVNGDPDAD